MNVFLFAYKLVGQLFLWWTDHGVVLELGPFSSNVLSIPTAILYLCSACCDHC
jgi:hypothetical protein